MSEWTLPNGHPRKASVSEVTVSEAVRVNAVDEVIEGDVDSKAKTEPESEPEAESETKSDTKSKAKAKSKTEE